MKEGQNKEAHVAPRRHKDKNIREISSTSSMLSVAIILFAVVVFILSNYRNPQPHQHEKNAHATSTQQPEQNTNHKNNHKLVNKHNMNRNIRKRVEEIKWEGEENFYHGQHQINKDRKNPVPVLLKDTLVKTWPAFSQWSKIDYLINHPSLSGLVDVDIGNSNTFLYVDEGQDMWTEGIPGLKPRQYEIKKMKLEDMFHGIHDPEDNKYYYYYGKVEGKLLEDVNPNHVLWRTKVDQARGGIYLWLSGEDVRPALHFDSDHNFFIHLNGSKRFVLFPPWEWENLYVYPRLHPSWHKSQIDFDSTDLQLFPKALHAPAYEAILEPGDVLYVPPYWFHHVESLTPAVSLASWSEFSAHAPMHELFHSEMSWRDYSDDKQTQLGLIKLYVENVLQGLLVNTSAIESFMHKFLESRWTPPIAALVKSRVTVTCPQNIEITDEMLEGLDEDVEVTIRCFSTMTLSPPRSTKYEAAIMDIMLADWVELAVSEVVGASNTLHFLRACIDTTSPLDEETPTPGSQDWDA